MKAVNSRKRLNSNSVVGSDGALRRPRAVTDAERIRMSAGFAQFFPTAERGRGQRSAPSLPPLFKAVSEFGLK